MTTPPQPADAALEQLLDAHLNASAGQLAPSSGFVLSVMDVIHQQAAEPAPIAFPWRRVLPGAVAVLCALIAFAVLVLSGLSASHAAASFGPTSFATVPSIAAITSGTVALLWTLMAGCISLAAVAASFRVAGRNR